MFSNMDPLIPPLASSMADIEGSDLGKFPNPSFSVLVLRPTRRTVMTQIYTFLLGRITPEIRAWNQSWEKGADETYHAAMQGVSTQVANLVSSASPLNMYDLIICPLS